MARALARVGRAFDPQSETAFGVQELEVARRYGRVEYGCGDILLVHTGFLAWYLSLSVPEKGALPGTFSAPGLARDEDVCRYLWDNQMSAVASDNPAVEVWPSGFDAATGRLQLPTPRADRAVRHGTR